LNVILLGTGGPQADLGRHECCTLVTIGSKQVLLDAGRGATVQLRRAGVDLDSVNPVLLTHHHLDHLVELPSLIRMTRASTATPLRIIGPPDTQSIVDQLLGGPFAKSFAADRAYDQWRQGSDVPHRQVEAEDITGGSTLEFDDWTLRVAEVEHGQRLLGIGSWWQCLGYRIETEGKSVVMSGDCTYTSGLVEFAHSADVLVQSCSWSESEVRSERDRDEADGFIASAAVAGRIAADAGVGTLVLTHFGPEARVDEMESDARRSYEGRVVIGEDLLAITL
jgi:ribonuclease Z